MPTLYLTESDVLQLLSVSDAIEALEHAFRAHAAGTATMNPRQRLRMPGATLHFMAAWVDDYFGYKAYTSAAGKVRFLVFLFKAGTTDPAAIIEADALGQIRTGAATGLATRLMAAEDAAEATLFGAGWQAETQLRAMAAVRPLRRVWIVNRSSERCAAFISKMQPLVEAELVPAPSAESALAKSAIVTTITSSREPVLKGDWLQPGQHINAAGANALMRRELDNFAMLRASRVVVDSLEQARVEAGEFLSVVETGKRQWHHFRELCDVVAGTPARVRPTDITIFKSLGVALEDVAVAKLVYERASAQGAGRVLL